MLTNMQKLEAVRNGQRGSYNFAFVRSANDDEARFEHIVREAHAIAMEKGYFCRPAELSEDHIATNGPLLITIENDVEGSGHRQAS